MEFAEKSLRYSCASNLLTYLGAESPVSSENPLKLLRIQVDFDSTIRRFESSAPARHSGNRAEALKVSGYIREYSRLVETVGGDLMRFTTAVSRT
jgi:hypothetical protein